MQEKLNKKEETEQMPTFCWKSVEEKISLRTQRQFFPWGEAEDARKINFLDELKDGSISKKKKKKKQHMKDATFTLGCSYAEEKIYLLEERKDGSLL